MDVAESLKRTLHRIRVEDRVLHAFVQLASDPIGPISGPSSDKPLGGMPIALKDLIDTCDMPTEYGSRIYRGYQPRIDAALVAELKRLGAFIVGKTTTTEFATSPPTETRNPRGLSHTPGGSSAGSAAAVSAGLVPVAFGTQTLGSIIRPASFCGVVGFKPTHGWFSMAGIKALAPSLDTIGLLSTSVAVVEQVYRALVPFDAEPPNTPVRLAFSRQPNWGDASAIARSALERCVDLLRSEGFVIDEIEMPEGFDRMTKAANIIHDYEMYRSLRAEWIGSNELLDPSLATRIENAARWTTSEYRQALSSAIEQRAAFDAFMKSYDAVVCLAATGEAPVGLSSTGDPAMNSAWTVLHGPCIALPLARGAVDMPIGVQLVAPRFLDLNLLRVAAMIERSLAIVRVDKIADLTVM